MKGAKDTGLGVASKDLIMEAGHRSLGNDDASGVGGGTGASGVPWEKGKADPGKQELKKPRAEPPDTMTNISADITEREQV